MTVDNSIQALRGGAQGFLDQALDTIGQAQGTEESIAAGFIPEGATPAVNLDNKVVKTAIPVEVDDFTSPFDKKDKADDSVAPVKDDGVFDPEAYDKETEAGLEAMGKASHPGEAFKKVRSENKEYKQKIADMESKLKGYESGEVSSDDTKAKLTEYEELKRQNEELSNKIAKVDYKETPSYQEQIVKPFQDIASLAKSIEERNGLEEGTILNAITKDNYNEQSDAVVELRSDLDDRSYNTLIKMADDMTILYQRDRILSENAAKLLQEANESKQELTAKQKLERDQAYGKSVSSVFENYQDKIPLFIGDDGKPNSIAKDLRAQASAVDFDSMTEDQKAFAAMSAVSFGHIMRDYNKLLKQVEGLSASKRLQDRVTPGLPESSGSIPSRAVSAGVVGEGESPSDAIKRIMGV